MKNMKNLDLANLVTGRAYTNYYYNNNIIIKINDPIILYWDADAGRDYIIYAGHAYYELCHKNGDANTIYGIIWMFVISLYTII